MKRATLKLPVANKLPDISIHALVKRATIARISVNLSYIYFNPRPREEGDFSMKLDTPLIDNFNPRPREEGDRFDKLNNILKYRFQSTPS